MKKSINVVAGIVINDGEILIAQRAKNKNQGLLWEFPGGKMEKGESPETTLVREFVEELNFEISVGKLFKQVDFDYDHAFVCLNIFFASSKNRNITNLTAHEKTAWVKPKQLKEYNLVPADALIVDELLEHLQNNSQSLF